MPNRVQTLRSSAPGVLPQPGTRLPGELWLNFADFALGFIDTAQAAQKLLAVRWFVPTASYAIGDFVLYSGNLYRALAPSAAGAFVAANWSKIGTAADLTAMQSYVDTADAARLLLAGGTLTGPLILAADPTVALGAATKQYADTKVPLAGGTMTGPLILSGPPTQNLQAATKAYVDSGAFLPIGGGTLTGPLILAADPTVALGAATKQYADTKFPTTGGALTGSLVAPAISVNAATPAYRAVNFTTANVMRWAVFTDATAESGSNAGSNFAIARYNDAGAALGSALSINRSTGAASFAASVTAASFSASGGVTASGGINCGSNGIAYSGLGGGNMVGFTWTSPGVNVAVDNVAQGNIVTGRSGGALTAIYAFSVNGTTGQAQATAVNGNALLWTITWSDPALKRDVVPAVKDALAAINSLKVWEYDYLSPFPDAEPQHWDWGLMADAELGAIIPPAFIPATPTPDTETYAQIRELPLTAALVKAVQQLTARVETLEARLQGAT